MTSSVYEIAMETALANFQENGDWVYTVSNSTCQLLALESLQADVNRLLELAFKGFDESVSGQDNRREASVQRSVLQGRLYSEIEIVTTYQKSLMQALCLFIFGRLIQHSPCVDTLNDASTMDSVHLLWARTLRDADRVIFLDDGNPDVVSAVRIIQFGSRLPINLEDYQAVQAEIQIATSEYEKYLRQLNEMAGKRIGGVAEEGVCAAIQDMKEAMHSKVTNIRNELRFVSLLVLKSLDADLTSSVMTLAGVQPTWQRYDPTARVRGSMSLSQWATLQRQIEEMDY